MNDENADYTPQQWAEIQGQTRHDGAKSPRGLFVAGGNNAQEWCEWIDKLKANRELIPAAANPARSPDGPLFTEADHAEIARLARGSREPNGVEIAILIAVIFSVVLTAYSIWGR